jgi:hypothetical protein
MKSNRKYWLLLYTIINLNFFSFSKFLDSSVFWIFVEIINFVPIILYFVHKMLIEENRSGYFSLPVSIFIASIILGAISAYMYYDQSLIQSLIVSHIFYPFFTYLLLVQSDFKKEDLLLVIKIVFWLTLLVFVIDFFTFPDTLFAWRDEEREERQALGLFFYGQGFTILGALIYLENYLSTNKFKYLIPFIISFVFIVFLTGSRTYFFALSISSLFLIFYFLKNLRSLGRKLYFTILLCLLGLTAVYYLQDHFSNLVDMTKGQFLNYSNDIRFNCIIYYATEFQDGFFTKIFGNGFPSPHSDLGTKLVTAKYNDFYASDIGIIGLWAFLGILSVLAWVLIFVKVFNKRYIWKNVAVCAFFVYLLINAFLTYTLFDPGYIIAYIFALYLFTPDIYKREVILAQQVSTI